MWQLDDKALDEKTLIKNESIFALANGYLGVRGNFEEGYPNDYQSIRGTYINGFYDIDDINYGEKAFGYPKTQQKIINIIDAQGIVIYLDGEKVNLFSDQAYNFDRHLFFDRGYSERIFKYKTKNQQIGTISIKRMVSFETKEFFSIEVSIIYSGRIKIITSVNADVANYADKSDPRVNHGETKFLHTNKCLFDDNHTIVSAKTKVSNLDVCCVSMDLLSKDVHSMKINKSEHKLEKIYEVDQEIILTKYNIFTDSIRHDEVEQDGIRLIEDVIKKSFHEHLIDQEHYLKNFWKYANIEINGDDSLQLGLRFNLFHLLQSVGKGHNVNISAKGLTGEGYEGHYFWDTEIFIFPVFLNITPNLAKNILLYRYSILNEARKRAKVMGHQNGALFPWRTITGAECSAYFPAGSAQYHINADISYSFIKYYLVTKDISFMENYGAEVLFETARLYANLVHLQDGQYHINTVTGPDEYTALVNNNYYTNVMVKFNLTWAVNIYYLLKKNQSKALDKLFKKIALKEAEIDTWENISKNMCLLYESKLGINPQDDSFLKKKKWDFENTPKSNYPLLLYYHPLTIYRHQVCKQADTVLAHFLLEDEQEYRTIENSYYYYEKVTTHDSSLSSCIFSIMGSKVNDLDKAYHYFMKTARLDLDDTQGNTKDGLHMANMGGTWMAIVYGFAGLRIKKNGIFLSPRLPKQLKGYSFNIQYQNNLLKVNILSKTLKITLIEGEFITLFIFNQRYEINKYKTYEYDIEQEDIIW